MPRLKVYLLGPPRIELDSLSVKVETHKALALLAYLAVTGKSYRRDFLINLLWPDHNRSKGLAALRRSLFALKGALPDEYLDVDRENVGLNSDADLWVDVDRFHRLLAGCREHGHTPSEACADCVEPLTEIVGLYRGDFLEGFSLEDSVNFDDWQFSQIQDFHSDVVNALERLVDWHIGRDELEVAIQHCQRCLGLDRSNEGIHRHLIKSYANTGRRTAALRQYEECVRVLGEELDVPPQEETTQLYEAIKENSFSMKGEEQETEVPPIHKHVDIPKDNLPRQLTSFIGRGDEMEEIKRLLTIDSSILKGTVITTSKGGQFAG